MDNKYQSLKQATTYSSAPKHLQSLVLLKDVCMGGMQVAV